MKQRFVFNFDRFLVDYNQIRRDTIVGNQTSQIENLIIVSFQKFKNLSNRFSKQRKIIT